MSINKATSNLKPRLAPLKSGLSIAAEIGISISPIWREKRPWGLLERSCFSLASCLIEIARQRKSTDVGVKLWFDAVINHCKYYCAKSFVTKESVSCQNTCSDVNSTKHLSLSARRTII